MWVNLQVLLILENEKRYFMFFWGLNILHACMQCNAIAMVGLGSYEICALGLPHGIVLILLCLMSERNFKQRIWAKTQILLILENEKIGIFCYLYIVHVLILRWRAD